MIKLKSKVALLLAAASVTALVPTQGAFASTTTRLESKDGSIDKAIALPNGQYVYTGYKSDNQESGVYISKHGSDKEIVDNGITGKYGDKYIELDSNSDNLLDTTTGKVVTNEDADSLEDNAKTSLYKKLKKIDDLNISSQADIATEKVSKSTRFEANVYTFLAKNVSGLTDDNGNYSVLNKETNLSVYDSTNNKLVKIDKFDKEENGFKATLDGYKLIAQTSDKYYILSKVTVTTVATGATKTDNYIQVISKSTKTGDNNYLVPNTVTSYLATNDIYNGDSPKVDKVLADGTNFAANNDGLVYYTVSGTNLEVGKVNLHQGNVALADGASKVQAKYASVENVDSVTLTGSEAYSVDTTGAIWAITDGKIDKYSNKSFEDVYKVGNRFIKLDVYDKDNLIAWDGDDSYVTTAKESNTTKESTTDSSTTDSSTKSTADNTTTDNTTKSTTDSTKSTTQTGIGGGIPAGWLQEGANWAYIKPDQSRATGWIQDSGKWYLLNTKGVMQTGWVKDGDTWYLLNNSGAMQTGWVKDGDNWYYLANNGAMQTGWLKDANGSWYYLNSNGSMAANTTVNGYELGANGAWIQ